MPALAICNPNCSQEEIDSACEYAKNNNLIFNGSIFREKSARVELEKLLSEKREASKIILMQGVHPDQGYLTILRETTGLEVETRTYQLIIRPEFSAIKTFIGKTIENHELHRVDSIIGIYDGGSVPSMIAKHAINNMRRQEKKEEISIYPLRLRTTSNDGICSNHRDNSVILQYFIEPPINQKPHFLIMEDIVSYGKTLDTSIRKINDMCWKKGVVPKISIVSVVFNRERYLMSGIEMPNNFYYAIETKDRDWVIFPWEHDDGKRGVFI